MAIVAGQSNSAGRNGDDGLETFGTNIYHFGGNSSIAATYQTLAPLSTLLDHQSDGSLGTTTGQRRVGPGINAAKKLEAQNPTSKIVVVPCGKGSQALASGTTPPWASSATPGLGGSSFEFMCDQAALARTAILAQWPGATITPVVFFIQGEQDGGNAASYATYYAALTDFVTNVRSRITGASSANIVLGSMVPEKWTPSAPSGYNADYVPINQAHVMASINITGVKYAVGPTDPGALNDNLHYQPASAAREQGDRLGDALSDVTGPTVSSASSTSNTASTTLAFALTSADQHATFHINGGADAAQFEISDPYLTPTLRWTGNGTGPAAGTYVVGIRARDGAGNYGATQTFTATVAAVGSISPVTFFTSGERGMVWDLTDLSSLSQTIDGLTPVTTAGQSVGYVADKSGNGNHWIAAADNTTRPTYQVDSDGKPYLSFDGSNDVLFAGTPFVTDANRTWTLSIGLFAAAQSAAKSVISCNSTSSGTPFATPLQTNGATGNLRIQVRNDASASLATVPEFTSALDSTKRVLTNIFRGGGGVASIRSAASRPVGGGTGSYTSATAGTWGGTLTVNRVGLGAGAGSTPANFYNGRIYSGYVINRALTDTEIKNGEDWTAVRQLTSTLP